VPPVEHPRRTDPAAHLAAAQKRSGNLVRLTVSHQRLLEAIRALLAALSYTQEAQLSGGHQVKGLPLFNQGLKAPKDATSDTPDRIEGNRQLSLGHLDFRICHLVSGTASSTATSPEWSKTIGTIVVTGDDPVGSYPANREYWNIDMDRWPTETSIGFTIWVADVDDAALPGNTELQSVLSWSGGTAWQLERLGFDEVEVTATESTSSMATCPASTNTGAADIGLKITGTTSPVANWYQDDSQSLVVANMDAATIETPADGYSASFTADNKAVFNGGGPASLDGWTRYDSVEVV
jgi:hypothetical protein